LRRAIFTLGPLLNTDAPGSGSAAMASVGNLSHGRRGRWLPAALHTHTLAYVERQSQVSSKTVEDIRRDDGLALRIPDYAAPA